MNEKKEWFICNFCIPNFFLTKLSGYLQGRCIKWTWSISGSKLSSHTMPFSTFFPDPASFEARWKILRASNIASKWKRFIQIYQLVFLAVSYFSGAQIYIQQWLIISYVTFHFLASGLSKLSLYVVSFQNRFKEENFSTAICILDTFKRWRAVYVFFKFWSETNYDSFISHRISKN